MQLKILFYCKKRQKKLWQIVIFDLSQSGITTQRKNPIALGPKKRIPWSQTVIFGSFQISFSKNKKIRGLIKEDFSLWNWKYFFTVGLYLSKISNTKYMLKNLLCSNWDLWSFSTWHSKIEKRQVFLGLKKQKLYLCNSNIL